MRHPNAKQYRKKPLISVIVIAQNNEETIENTLNSIIKNTYRKHEVIVVDNASTDATANTVKDFIKGHRKYSIKLVSKRRPVLLKSAIEAALTKKPKGSLIMVLDGTSLLDKFALKTASQHFAEEDISVLIPSDRIQDYPGLIGLMQQFEQPLNVQSHKLGLGIDSTGITGGYGTIYKRAALTRLKRFIGTTWADNKEVEKASKSFANKTLPSYFASDIVITHAPLEFYGDLLRNYYWRIAGNIATLSNQARLFTPLSQPSIIRRIRPFISVLSGLTLLIEPFVVGYLAYVAIHFKMPAFYLIVWLAMSALLGLALMKEQSSWRDRLKKALLLPIMYNLLLVTRFMQIIVFLAYVLNFKRWTTKNNKTKKPLRKTNSKSSKKKTQKKSKLAVA